MIKAGDFKCPCPACKALGDAAPGITIELAGQLDHMEILCANYLQRAGFVFTVTSGRRCAAHNASIGGAPDSQHLHGVAADLLSDDSETHYAIVSAAMAVGIPFVEVCPHHVHVDLRPGAKRLILGAG